jgi:phosphinothricin acetyltransferase
MGELRTLTRPAIVLRRARPADNPRIAAIWNYEVTCTTATTETEPRSPTAQRRWLAAHDDAHPVIVAVSGGDVLGYGSLSPYRDRSAFRATVEDSVYVKTGLRGRGVGSGILEELLRLAYDRGHHAVMARITAGNGASQRLHGRLGFTVVGIERETAIKFGRWHDIVIMQRLLVC